MRAVNLVRGVGYRENTVEMRSASAAGACSDVELENDGNKALMLLIWRVSLGRRESKRRRGRGGGLADKLWRAVRLVKLLDGRTEVGEGPEAGVLNDLAARLLFGDKQSPSFVSRGAFSQGGV